MEANSSYIHTRINNGMAKAIREQMTEQLFECRRGKRNGKGEGDKM